MINHIVLGTSNIDKARPFYDAALGALGIRPAILDVLPSGVQRLFYRHDGISFAISEPLNRQPATVANGTTIAFRCNSPEQVRHFHDAAIANGGIPIEDAPGIRHNPIVGDVYSAYVRDPDGNKLCATHRMTPTG